MGKPSHDLRGRKFGQWAVLKFYGNPKGKGARWICRCRCGTERDVHSSELLRGSTKSCGCTSVNRKKEMLGRKSGYWTVIAEAGKNRHGQITWMCECVCGFRRLKTGVNLRARNSHSCGCRGEDPGTVGFNAVLKAYTRSAINRGIRWNLKLDDFKKLLKQNCFYCGDSPSRISWNKNGVSKVLRDRNKYIYNGIDRVNSDKGYTIANCIPCCTICNLAKLDTPQDDFISWVHKVAAHLKQSPKPYRSQD